MHNTSKRIVAVLLSVVMVLSVFGGMTFTASAAASGSCGANGSNVRWTLDNGVLTISGTGDMADYSSQSGAPTAPWGGAASSITSIVVESGVTSIGSHAFYYLDHAASVSIADTVQTIKSNAFRTTSSLTSVTIPGSVKTIESFAFYYCAAETVTIEEGVQSLGDSCFSAAYVVTLTIPKSLKTFGNSAFGNCANLVSVYYNGTVEDWSAITFDSYSSTPLYYAKNLYLEGTLFEGELVIPSNMTSIDTAQFAGFNCTSIVFPENLTQIGQYAFSNCASLAAAEIPDGVTSIGNYAFSGCASLTHIHIPSSVTSIGSDAFRYCTSLEYICSEAFGNTAQTYARNNEIGFRCCTPGASVTVTFDSAGGFAVPFQNIPVNGTATEPTPTKTGHAFLGWTLNGEVYDFSTPVTEDITLSAVWVEGAAASAQSFDSSSLPSGWTNDQSKWSFKSLQVVSSKQVTPHAGNRFAYHSNSTSSYLISPSMDLSGKSVVKLTFWYQNRYNGTKHDDLKVSYRVAGGTWVDVFRTDAEHTTWTSAIVALPADALQSNVQIGFYADVRSGYGVFLDDFEVVVDPVHTLTYTASGNVLTAACAKDACTLDNNAITLTLNAPAKTTEEDEASAEATLSGLGLFNLHTGLSVSADSIEYYDGSTKLDAAPTDGGSYTASLTVTVDGTDYTITKDYAIQGPHKHTTADNTTVSFLPWESANSLPTSGSYYLTQNVTVAAKTELSGDLNLCLAGKTVTMTGSGSVLYVPSGKTLNLFDETGDAGVITGGNASEGGGILVYGTLNMYGGTVSGNTASNGGGIYGYYNSTINLYGGTISGNSATTYGGGIVLLGSTLNMYGGTISGNSARHGGGVQAMHAATFNMYYGTITQNTCTNYGGGVDLVGSSDGTVAFTMYDGVISDNTAANQYGGGLYMSNTTSFTLEGGTISGNSAKQAGGIYVYGSGSATIKDGSITGNSATQYGGGIYTSGVLSIQGGTISGNTAGTLGTAVYDTSAAGKFTLSAGTISGTIVVSNPITITGNLGDKVYTVGKCSGSSLTTGVVTSGLSGKGTIANIANGNGSGYIVTETADGEAQLVKAYTITWKRYDGTILRVDENVPQGTMPSYGSTPTKESDSLFDYTFDHWSPNIVSVSGNKTYTAYFTKTASSTFRVQCGDNVYATVEDGVLIISGTGDMYDYNDDLPAWCGLTLSGVVIEEGVTSIGDNAFHACESLESIEIPGSVTTIGKWAFYWCESLESVDFDLPSGLTTIGDFAFNCCFSLASIELPDSVTTVGEGVFDGCDSLTSVSLPSGLTTISDAMFLDCESLESIVIPQGVTTIGEEAFMYCESLTAVTIPASVETIGEDAFYRCSEDLTIYCAVNNAAATAYAQSNSNVSFVVLGDQQFVSVDDQIALTVLLNLDSRGKTTDDVTITLDNESYTCTGTPVAKGQYAGLYKFTIVMAPAQIADEIVVTIDGDAQPLTTSAKNYCTTLSGSAYDAYVNEQALARAILAYGQAANNAFGYSADTIADISGLDISAAQNAAAVFSDSTGKVTGASFMALTKPEFRFYTSSITEAQAVAYNQAGVTAAMDGGRDTLNARFVKKADNSVLLEVTGVSAENMDKTITVSITGLGTITFNGNAFARAMANSSNTTQQNLGAALYNYGAAAKTCFGA